MWPEVFFEFIGNYYRDIPHMTGLKIGALICCLFDILGVWALLRCMDLARNRPPSKWKNAVLGVCAVLNVAQMIPKNSAYFFLTMFFVFFLPYVLLIHTMISEARYFVAFLRDALVHKSSDASQLTE